MTTASRPSIYETQFATGGSFDEPHINGASFALSAFLDASSTLGKLRQEAREDCRLQNMADQIEALALEYLKECRDAGVDHPALDAFEAQLTARSAA